VGFEEWSNTVLDHWEQLRTVQNETDD